MLGLRRNETTSNTISSAIIFGILVIAPLCQCTPVNQPGNNNGNPTPTPVWRSAFDTTETGALSAVWGSSSQDVFVVGGTREQGEVYHFDGSSWRKMAVPEVPLLVWVFGFGQYDVYAVGEGGGAIRYDGDRWLALETGTDEDLWGVWGSAPDDLWIVGGSVGEGLPVILRFDGVNFSTVAVPDNDRNATALFKVWGIGSKVFAVGENGLIIEYDGDAWRQVSAGPAADDDFVSLWGTSENNIVAVGGRSTARIAHYDGTSWTTEVFSGTPGLNAIFMTEPDVALVGGANGFAGVFNPQSGELTSEDTTTSLCLHGIWGDELSTFFAVGGRFSEPLAGLALVRTLEAESTDTAPPPPPIGLCASDDDCQDGLACQAGQCVAAQAASIEYLVEFDAVSAPVADGDPIPVFQGFQGGTHTFVTIRATGFTPNGDATLTVGITAVNSGAALSTTRDLPIRFSLGSDGVNVAEDIFLTFDSSSVDELVGVIGLVSLTVTDNADPSISASLSRTVTLTEAN